MKKQASAKIFAFFIALTMFCAVPQFIHAQKQNNKHRCPKGYYPICYTDPWSGATRCYCYPASSLANVNIKEPSDIETHSIINSNGIAIEFQLMDAQNVSLKIYDGTGRLVKNLVDQRMTQGDHEIEWNAKDENDNSVTTGNYILQLTKGDKVSTKKFLLYAKVYPLIEI